MIKVGFKQIHPKAKVPRKATNSAAGFDVETPVKFHIEHGQTAIIPLGFAVDIPEGYCMRIIPRSGLASRGLTVNNSPGLIDSDYKQEVKLILHSNGGIFGFDIGDRVCQITFEKVLDVEFVEVDTIVQNGRGGLGSTGGFSIEE